MLRQRESDEIIGLTKYYRGKCSSAAEIISVCVGGGSASTRKCPQSEMLIQLASREAVIQCDLEIRRRNVRSCGRRPPEPARDRRATSGRDRQWQWRDRRQAFGYGGNPQEQRHAHPSQSGKSMTGRTT